MPSIHTQFSMNTFCETDLNNYLNYMDALEEFHEEKRLYFYPKIFDNVPIKSENWEALKLEYIQDQRAIEWFSLFPLMFSCLILLCLARQNLRQF